MLMKKGTSCINWAFIYKLIPDDLEGHFVAYIIPIPTKSILQDEDQKMAENLQWNDSIFYHTDTVPSTLAKSRSLINGIR